MVVKMFLWATGGILSSLEVYISFLFDIFVLILERSIDWCISSICIHVVMFLFQEAMPWIVKPTTPQLPGGWTVPSLAPPR